MKNLIETLKKIGFETDFPDNHLSLYVDSGSQNDESFAIIRISDYETEDLPTENTKKLFLSIETTDGKGNQLGYFFRVIGE